GGPASRMFAPGGPHGLRGDAVEREHLKIVRASELQKLMRREARVRTWGTIELQTGQASGAQDAVDLAQKGDHQLAAGDEWEERKRVDKIKRLIGEIFQAGA